MSGTQSPKQLSSKLQKIAKLAKDKRGVALTTLAHHIDIDWLKEAYKRTRKDGAPGIDGQTGTAYAEHLEERLQSLLNRAKLGELYRAPPVRRVEIPKGNGGVRPLGIPTFEDKVLQRAVLMVLDAVYEQDFLDCSYGFRPGRGQHDAQEAIRQHAMKMGGGWVLEADIKSYFDSVAHGHLRAILRHRVRDGVLLRLIGKWLKAGVMQEGCVYHPEQGTPQGGVISPLLANVYLHEVLDQWFMTVVRPRMKGRAELVRFADDFVLLFAREDDARRVAKVLPKRLARYSLELHPEKTRLLRFERPRHNNKRRPKGDKRPQSFDFLGFTFYWGRSRKGRWVVRTKTSASRFSRTLRRISEYCRRNRHEPIAVQHKVLTQKLEGHDNYYGTPGNYRALANLRWHTRRIWHKWLNRRSHQAYIPWEKMQQILAANPLPAARIVHSHKARAAKP